MSVLGAKSKCANTGDYLLQAKHHPGHFPSTLLFLSTSTLRELIAVNVASCARRRNEQQKQKKTENMRQTGKLPMQTRKRGYGVWIPSLEPGTGRHLIGIVILYRTKLLLLAPDTESYYGSLTTHSLCHLISSTTELTVPNYVEDTFQTIVKTVRNKEKRKEKNEEGRRQPISLSPLARCRWYLPFISAPLLHNNAICFLPSIRLLDRYHPRLHLLRL